MTLQRLAIACFSFTTTVCAFAASYYWLRSSHGSPTFGSVRLALMIENSSIASRVLASCNSSQKATRASAGKAHLRIHPVDEEMRAGLEAGASRQRGRHENGPRMQLRVDALNLIEL